MGFSSQNGYTPVSVETILLDIMSNLNTQFGTTYTIDTFVGTNYYKQFYALAQRVQLNEIKTSEIFVYLPTRTYLCRPGKKNRFYPEKGIKILRDG